MSLGFKQHREQQQQCGQQKQNSISPQWPYDQPIASCLISSSARLTLFSQAWASRRHSADRGEESEVAGRPGVFLRISCG